MNQPVHNPPLVTEAQIDAFQADGVVVIRGVFTDWVDTIRAGIERAQLLVEAAQRGPLHAFLRAWLGELRARKSGVRWQIEVDPAEI